MIEEVIQISLLSEYFYCKRRCSLYLLEGKTKPNYFISKGTVLHKNYDTYKVIENPFSYEIFSFQVFSKKLSLIGKCDKVIFEKDKNGTFIPFLNDYCYIFPVECKSGEIREKEFEYIIQLCAYAVCLEEMYNCKINYGYLYFLEYDKYIKVDFTSDLKHSIILAVDDILKIIDTSHIYSEKYKKRCKSCNLFEKCSPLNTDISKYIKTMKEDLFYDNS